MNRSHRIALIAGCALGAHAASAQVVINELYANPPGSGNNDNRLEFIEIYGPPGMSLTGWAIGAVNGGQDPNGNDVPGPLSVGDPQEELAEIDECFSLDGLFIGPNGLLVLHNIATSAPLSFVPGLADPATPLRTFQQAHIPTTDTAGRLNNDGSMNLVLVRRRPFHALTLDGVSLLDGVPANTITIPNYPADNRYAFRKDVKHDVNYDGRYDLNGIGTFIMGGGPVAPETPVVSENGNNPGSPRFLEPLQVVDDVAWSNLGGKEYTRCRQQEISDTPNYNPDAVSRIAYYGANPQRGSIFSGGEMSFTRMADEEWIYGDIIDFLEDFDLQYEPARAGGPTDQNGPTYNELGQLDPSGTFLLNDINLAGFRVTPGRFNDVDGSASGGTVINQFRFVPGDFNFDGVVDCADRALIVQAAAEGWTLDDTELKTRENGTDDPSDDFTFTGWKWESRAFNGVLAMIRMDLSDGSTGEWTSGQIVQGGAIVGWGGAVTAADLAAFDAANPSLDCTLCPPCAADFNNDEGVDDLDIAAFFAAFESGDSCADANGDDGIDDLDIAFFFTQFEQGC